MHETSLMQNLLADAAQALAPFQVARVNEICVKAGILASVLPDALTFAFEALSQGTIFAGAELSLEQLPLTARCRRCGAEYDSMEIPPHCPTCGSGEAEIAGGWQVLLAAIDFDETEAGADRQEG